MTARAINHRQTSCDLDQLAALRLLWRIVERARSDARSRRCPRIAAEAREWLDGNGFGHESLPKRLEGLP